MEDSRLGNFVELLRDLRIVYRKLSRRRRYQLGVLLILQLLGAALDVASLGAVLPFLGALTNANELLTLAKLRPWLDYAGVTTPRELITLMAVIFCIAVVLANAFRILTFWAQARIGSAIASDLSTEIYRRTLHQPYTFHASVNSGTLISIITNDFNGAMGVVRNAMMLVTQGTVIVAIFLALIAYDPKMALTIGGLIFGAYGVISKVSKAYLLENGKIASDKYMLMVKALQEGLGGIRDIILDSNQRTFIDIFGRADRPMRRARANTLVIRSVPRYLLEIIGIVILSGTAAILSWQEENYQSVLPIMGGLAMAAIRLLPAVQQAYASFASMQDAHISLKRSLIAMERPLDPTSIAGSDERLQLQKGISLEGVWFHYDEAASTPGKEDWVLKDASLEIPVNTTIALVGATGGGKSTIADLLLGLLRPSKGRVLVDGVELAPEMLASWRRNISHVPQNIYLSDASIKENIAFGIPVERIDMERVRSSARSASIADFIEGRPAGYDEIIGERGIRLSGGQRQRIGIARALYKRASTIIFDEATSALDNVTEQEVMDAIANLSGQITMVLIAHRLSTIRSADQIFEIHEGRVVGQGKYEELIAKSDTFRAMALAGDTGMSRLMLKS